MGDVEIHAEAIPCGESVTTTHYRDDGTIERQDVAIHVSVEALKTAVGEVR